MACFSCRSENVKAFTSEINIRFPGRANLTKSLPAFPKLLVCLDCGLADVLLSEDESLVSVDVPNRQSNAEKMSTLQNCVHGS
jgi:hypothetical protein